MAKLYNLVRVLTSTTGDGPVTLGSAVSGHLTFSDAGLRDGDTISYAIVDGSDIEIGRGIYHISGPTLTRIVLQSSNNNLALDLSGSAEVYISEMAGGDVATPGSSSTGLEEGPGISLIGSMVGLGGDSILLFDAGGGPVAEQQADDSGFDLASYAAGAGDRIEVPQNAALSSDHVLAAGVHYWFRPGAQVSGKLTLGAETRVYGLILERVGDDENDLVGVVGPSSGTGYLYFSKIASSQSGAGNAYGLQANGGDLDVYDCLLDGQATGGGDGYGGYSNNGTISVFGGRAAGSTARFYSE